MNTRTLSQSVESLSKEQQKVVFDVVETLRATHQSDVIEKLTPAQHEMITARLEESFEPADPVEVDAFFARHGI